MSQNATPASQASTQEEAKKPNLSAASSMHENWEKVHREFQARTSSSAAERERQPRPPSKRASPSRSASAAASCITGFIEVRVPDDWYAEAEALLKTLPLFEPAAGSSEADEDEEGEGWLPA